ncbi:MAG: hypothetical protein ACRDV1_15475 [Actinomycetes bacterium]
MGAGSDLSPDLLSSGPDRAFRRVHTWLWRAGGAAAALALVLTLGPDLVPGPPAPPRDEPTAPALVRETAALTWEGRGDLASDVGFVEAALARLSRGGREAGPVLVAQTLPDGSRLLVAGGDARGQVRGPVSALHWPAGRPVSRARVSSVTELTGRGPLLGWAVRSDDRHVSAVVLGPPRQLRVLLSPATRFGAGGTSKGRWLRLADRDGLVVSDLGSPPDPAVAVRSGGADYFPTAFVVVGGPRD